MGESSSTVVRSQAEPGIAVLTLNRPDRLNAMTPRMLAALHEALDELADDRECRVVVLTGAGRGFCAGLDLRRTASAPTSKPLVRGPVDGLRSMEQVSSLVPKLRALPQPVIAAVNGPAAGGGFSLALACDLRVADPTATFSASFIRIGLSGCELGLSFLLPRAVGTGVAFELMLTGRAVDADEARATGLVNHLSSPGAAVERSLEVARAIVANTPFGVRLTKQVMWAALEVGSLQSAIELENRTQVLAAATADQTEALLAFVDKRRPSYRDA